jgi:mevalonate kinase
MFTRSNAHMLTMITATAPGKLMLFGEHAVVYGYPCIVTTVGLYVSATVTSVDHAELVIDTPQLRAQGIQQHTALAEVGQALRPETAFVEAAAARAIRMAGSSAGLQISTDGPARSYGLGSSSAVTVAVAAALNEYYQLKLDERGLFDLAYGAVLDAQGKGSGFDVAAAIYGGTIWFERRGAVIERLNVPALPFLIGYSGAKVSTRRFVDGVGHLRERNPALVEQIFATMAQIVTEARPALEYGEWARLGDLIDLNQGLLDAIGVNTPPLANLIFATRAAGALGAKISGAGGGDCMFALVGDERLAARQHPVAEAICATGELVDLPLGVGGVRVHSG